ncbi:hypothetical protein L2E82_11665 [Cichorium intybus]|uniref:Uncharacterized protein n=1 Tax=Cichorium intybus TaxID=13427 RepID=A0ACB9GEZ3_CICIN|nr:hypothetical protein L2E82_11665 [Cichorium intybus]
MFSVTLCPNTESCGFLTTGFLDDFAPGLTAPSFKSLLLGFGVASPLFNSSSSCFPVHFHQQNQAQDSSVLLIGLSIAFNKREITN